MKLHIIKLNPTTTVSVKEEDLFRPRWVKFFGSVEAVEEFIKNNAPLELKNGYSIYTKPKH
jgi:hypothetical protein